MSAAKYTSLTIDQIRVGDQLPPLLHEVTTTSIVLGALASRDWRPMHHDRDFAQQRNGTRDIFMNTPNQAAWLERFITDWAGPKARIGRYKFRMGDSICPGDTMVFSGTVESTETDEHVMRLGQSQHSAVGRCTGKNPLHCAGRPACACR